MMLPQKRLLQKSFVQLMDSELNFEEVFWHLILIVYKKNIIFYLDFI